MQMRDQYRQEHDQDEHVFPEHDYLGVEQFVEWDTPRAFSSPKRSTETNQPWTVGCGARFAVLHWDVVVSRYRYNIEDRTSNIELKAIADFECSMFSL